MTHASQRPQALFKADHPRDIDRHIDFFGRHEGATHDMCGEALLDALTHGSANTGGDADGDETPSCA